MIKIERASEFVEKGGNKIPVWLDDFPDAKHMISIMMTPLDVHFQKAPIDGEIKNVKHVKGKHRNAMKDAERVLQNEHQEILIDGDLRVKVIQIAGMAARRCVSLVEKSQKVKKGQDLGLIRFGSQVTLIIPDLPLKIKVGDKVKAGQSIIATYEK